MSSLDPRHTFYPCHLVHFDFDHVSQGLFGEMNVSCFIIFNHLKLHLSLPANFSTKLCLFQGTSIRKFLACSHCPNQPSHKLDIRLTLIPTDSVQFEPTQPDPDVPISVGCET